MWQFPPSPLPYHTPPLPLPFQDTKHVCDLVCGKKLQCGQHSCVELCHKGHCGKCWEYSEFFCRMNDVGRALTSPLTQSCWKWVLPN